MMDTATEERLAKLEKRLGEYDELLKRLAAMAKAHPAGKAILKMLGILP